MRQAMWELAEVYYEIDEASAWHVMGGYETPGEWLAAEEIAPRTYRRLFACWRELVVIREVGRATLAALDASKVEIVLPALQSNNAPGLTRALN
jgi:hypothetical protein